MISISIDITKLKSLSRNWTMTSSRCLFTKLILRREKTGLDRTPACEQFNRLHTSLYSKRLIFHIGQPMLKDHFT